MPMQKKIATIDRMMNILEIIRKSRSPIGVSMISKETGVAKATAFRVLQTLLQYKMVEKNDHDEYYLGSLFIRYGEYAKRNYSIRSIAEPHLKQLAEETGESSNLGIRNENEVITILTAPGESSIMLVDLIPVSPLHCSSMGKILLSSLSKQEILSYFNEGQPVKKRTVNTLTTYEEFLDFQKNYAATGISYDLEEYDYGLCCIAAPIFNSSGDVIAAMNLSGPLSRLKIKGLNVLERSVRKTSAAISTAASEILL